MLLNFSTWNCVDLHIHSAYSNKVKANDYDGSDCSGKTFLDILLINKVNIFSITDHNSINAKLYNEIESLISTPDYQNLINYVIGVELDINDSSIYEKVFHCLCLFKTRDVNLVKKCIDDIFDNFDESERNSDNVYPTVKKIFEKLHSNKINDIILIPHFNNKKKGIPTKSALDHLNYLCFNAYEDSNNIKNIEKSLKIYLEKGFNDFPFAVFTDNHDIQKYPIGKNGFTCEKCFMLSNIQHPFNSVKTAFEEPHLRIAIDKVDGMRKTETPYNYIEKIILNDHELYLSPYQNTIIGKFGSGKSLLLEKIRNGQIALENNDKYKDFFNIKDKFNVCTSNQIADSLSEIMNQSTVFVKYDFFQQEDYYHKNKLDEKNLCSLLNRLNIQYELKKGITFDFNKDAIKKSFAEADTVISKSDVKNNLNYEKAFDNQQYFNVEYSFLDDNLSDVLSQLSRYKEKIVDVSSVKLFGEVDLFSDKEKNNLSNIIALIDRKVKMINELIKTNFVVGLKELIDNYQNTFIKNDEMNGLNIFNTDLCDFSNKIIAFKNDCRKFQNSFSEEIYQLNIQRKKEKVFSDYSIEYHFDGVSDFSSPVDCIIKDKHRVKDNLFQSVLKTLNDNKKFHSNYDFNHNIDSYCKKCNSYFTKEKIRYDFLKSNDSMLKKSAGEKSSLFIELLFKKIEDDINKGKYIILMMDQPEDNIDNENIYLEITEKIKELKMKYNNFQSIIVTHNANVGITADSENIIIAKEKIYGDGKKIFEYESGCIENPVFIERVCKILEGGIEAMKRRTAKYGINIIKKVVKNEA